MGGRYVLERDGNFYWLGGDIFGDYWPGKEIPAQRASCRGWRRCTPSIVVCIGLNYKDHAAEMNKKLPDEPLVFLKPRELRWSAPRTRFGCRHGPAASSTKPRWRW